MIAPVLRGAWVTEEQRHASPVGEVELSSGWQDYRISVPGELLERGFNEFLFTYSTTPYRIDPASRGRNTVIALESLSLERVQP